MLYITVILVVIGVMTALIRHSRKSREQDGTADEHSPCASCGSSLPECGHNCMLEASVKEIEYYDDEELDAFAGRRSDKYDDDEAGQFRYVLYTMRPDEVAGWCRSISLRGINLPDQIKDEVAMLIMDERG